jgi:hypothetical protein
MAGQTGIAGAGSLATTASAPSSSGNEREEGTVVTVATAGRKAPREGRKFAK